MELKSYERMKFNSKLRYLLIKNECESCGECKKLELHHDRQFAEMLKETLDRLNYEYKPLKEDYTKEQLENITDMLLGIHIKSKYTTLCEKCHTEIHSSGELIKHFLRRIKSEKIIIKPEDKALLIEYLNSIANKVILRATNREELITKIGLIDNHNSNIKENRIKLLKNIKSLNKYLKDIEVNFYIKQFSTSKTIKGNTNRYKSAWMIIPN